MEVPADVLEGILLCLPFASIGNFAQINQLAQASISSTSLWQRLWDRQVGQCKSICGAINATSPSRVIPTPAGLAASPDLAKRCIQIVSGMNSPLCAQTIDLGNSTCRHGLEAMYFVRRSRTGGGRGWLLLQPFVDSPTLIYSVGDSELQFEEEKSLEGVVCTLAFNQISDLNSSLMFQGGEGQISVWDISSDGPTGWSVTCRLSTDANECITCIEWLPPAFVPLSASAAQGHRGWLISSSDSGNVLLWNLQEWHLEDEVVTTPYPVSCICVYPPFSSISCPFQPRLLFVGSGATKHGLGSFYAGVVTVWKLKWSKPGELDTLSKAAGGLEGLFAMLSQQQQEQGQPTWTIWSDLVHTFTVGLDSTINTEASVLTLVPHTLGSRKFLISTDNCYQGWLNVFLVNDVDELEVCQVSSHPCRGTAGSTIIGNRLMFVTADGQLVSSDLLELGHTGRMSVTVVLGSEVLAKYQWPREEKGGKAQISKVADAASAGVVQFQAESTESAEVVGDYEFIGDCILSFSHVKFVSDQAWAAEEWWKKSTLAPSTKLLRAWPLVRDSDNHVEGDGAAWRV